MKPKCSKRVVNKWFDKGFPEVKDHACQFNAYRDGLCKRHHPAFGHPANSLPALEERARKLEEKLALVRAQISARSESAAIHSPS